MFRFCSWFLCQKANLRLPSCLSHFVSIKGDIRDLIKRPTKGTLKIKTQKPVGFYKHESALKFCVEAIIVWWNIRLISLVMLCGVGEFELSFRRCRNDDKFTSENEKLRPVETKNIPFTLLCNFPLNRSQKQEYSRVNEGKIYCSKNHSPPPNC